MKTSLTALVASLTFAARATAQDSVAATAAYVPVSRALSAFIEHERAAKGIPAISVALVRGPHVVWAAGFGWADSASGRRASASTVYRVGSVSRLFTRLRPTRFEPVGPAHGALARCHDSEPAMAKGTMMTIDGRRFDAPPVGHGIPAADTMCGTVLDLGQMFGSMVARGVTSSGGGFDVSTLEGHRAVGRDGGTPGFATSLLAMPEDSLGVAVIASLEAANGVTHHVAQTALRLMLDASAGRTLVAIDTTLPLAAGRALALMGRYRGARDTLDLDEYEGRLFMERTRGGSRVELRQSTSATDRVLVVDDRLAFGERLTALDDGRLALVSDTLVRERVPPSLAKIALRPPPSAAPAEFASLIGEYGRDDDVLYVRERNGKLNALVEWAFDYPLERLARDVYRFPGWGSYAGRRLLFHRGADGTVDRVTVAAVDLPRRPLPADDDRTNARITPVRSPAELRPIALAATPPAEGAGLRAPDLVELRSLDSSIHYDIRYATSNNFMGTPFYTSAHAFMQRPAAEAVVRAAAKLRALGYGLIIHDAYRPWYVTKMFWDGTPADKHVFVADPSQGSRHNRGCAVDLTLYDLRTGAPIRMTGGYDEFSDRSYPLYPGGTSSQRWHRDLLRRAMEGQGFTVYDAEWWHFDYKDWRRYPIGNRTFEQLAASSAPGRR